MLTAEYARDKLSYDPLTGVFVWKHRPEATVQWNGRYAGALAGCRSDGGYNLIHLYGRLYRAHHIAWLISYGSLPKLLDHINGDRSDNRLDNLREATQSQNCANSWRPHKSASGLKGVSRSGRKTKPWAAHIKQHGKSKFLGRYATADEAHAAYVAKAGHLYGEFARFQ